MKIIHQFILITLTFFAVNNVNAQCFPNQNFPTMGAYSYTLPGTAATGYVIQIECVGADGAPSMLNGTVPNQGGSGARMTAQFSLLGGDELTVFVGQAGQTGGNPAGGGGGGGSAVILNASDVLIATGAGGGGGLGGSTGTGGGGGANTNSPAQGGGAPGAAGGGGFNAAGANGVNSTGGGAGTLTSMGAGGSPGVVAGPGGVGFGGGGGGAGTVGGGGGGYQGGDGGAMSPQGGVGGDSYVNAGFMSSLVSAIAGVSAGGTRSNGAILITCISSSGTTQLVAMIDATTNPSCGGGMDGIITASATGGTPPYEFAIDGINFSSVNTFTGLGAGPYTITVMDFDASMATTDTLLIEPMAVSATVVGVIDNVCFGGMTGSLEVAGTGGSGNYTYSIDGVNFQSSGLFENLIADDYTVTIRDANNCEGTITVIVGEASELTVFLTVIDILCFGDMTGSIFVDVSGGSPPYEYALDGVTFQSANSFTNLGANTYEITVRDAEGCLKQESATIVQEDEIVITVTSSNAGCGGSGGSIMASAIGGVTPYTFTLNDSLTSSDGNFENLLPGNYELDVIDANGCIESTNVTINQVAGDPIVISSIDSGDLSCNGVMDGFIIVEGVFGGTPPYLYTLDTTSQPIGVFDMLGAGNHTITVTDSAGCSTSVEVELTEPDPLILNVDTIQHAVCLSLSNGEIKLSATGGVMPYTFTLNDSIVATDGHFSGLSTGVYSVMVTDANACSSSSILTVGLIFDVNILSLATEDAICFGSNSGSATFALSGNYNQLNLVFNGDTIIASNPDTITFDSLLAGPYSATAIVVNSCFYFNSIVIHEPAKLLLTVDSYTPPTDSTGGEITLAATGGTPPYEYSIDQGINYQSSPTFSDLPTGNYEFFVRDANGCIISVEFIIASTSNVNYLNSQIDLFPNPTSDLLEIKFGKQIEIQHISVYNQMGRLTHVEKIQTHQNANEGLILDCKSYPTGIYFMQIQTRSGIAFKQFLVTHY